MQGAGQRDRGRRQPGLLEDTLFSMAGQITETRRPRKTQTAQIMSVAHRPQYSSEAGPGIPGPRLGVPVPMVISHTQRRAELGAQGGEGRKGDLPPARGSVAPSEARVDGRCRVQAEVWAPICGGETAPLSSASPDT